MSLADFSFKGTMMLPPPEPQDPFGTSTNDDERRWVRNWLKRTRKRYALGKKPGRRTDIPRHAIEAGRIRFSSPDGTKAA